MTETRRREDIQRGNGSSERPLIRDLWQRDENGVPAMREEGNFDPSNPHVDFARYYSEDFAKNVISFLWSHPVHARWVT